MSLRRKLKDDFNFMVNNPRADIAQTRARIERDTQRSNMEYAKISEYSQGMRIAKNRKDLDRLYRGLRR
jgi:hypothetical protein